MIKVIFLDQDDSATEVEVAEGISIKDAAVMNGLDGIVAECGGCCSCATCHVFVEPADLAKFTDREAGEEAMLDFTATSRRDNSRLGCQLFVEEGMGSVTVRFPGTQR